MARASSFSPRTAGSRYRSRCRLVAGEKNAGWTAEEMGQCHGATTEFALEQRELEMIQAAAAHRGGQVRRMKSHLDALIADASGHHVRNDSARLDLGLVGVDLAFDETAHRVDDQRLFFAQTELHARPHDSRDVVKPESGPLLAAVEHTEVTRRFAPATARRAR